MRARIKDLSTETLTDKEKMSQGKLLLAAIAQCDEKYTEALVLLEENLVLLEKWWGKSDPHVIETLVRMATVVEILGTSDPSMSAKQRRESILTARNRARALLERALSIIRHMDGKDDGVDVSIEQKKKYPSESEILDQIKLIDYKRSRVLKQRY